MFFEDFRVGIQLVSDFLSCPHFVIIGVVEMVEFMLEIPEF